MDSLSQAVTNAIQSSDYTTLFTIFTKTPPSTPQPPTWHSLGQGEQRTLAAHFIKTSMAFPTFYPNAFRSPQIMTVITNTLSHLPPSVENAADNELRQKVFDFKVSEEEDYFTAAHILSGLRMDDSEGSIYYIPPIERCDVFVKVAECYLEEDLTVEAEGAVTKAGTIIESISFPNRVDGEEKNEKDESTVTLILRYKSTYARVLDANRKFLQAAMKYHDLSTAYLHTDAVDGDDLLSMLGRAVTCAILAPSGAQRQRVLGLVFKDERLSQLDAIPEFQSHSVVLTKMYKNMIVQKKELEQFESSLAPHQKAIMADGLTIIERGVLEHNMVAVSHLYTSIYFSQLGQLLGVVDADKAEKVAAKMISNGSLSGSIDEVEGVLRFHSSPSGGGGSGGGRDDSSLLRWDEAITSFCVQLNKVTEAVRSG